MSHRLNSVIVMLALILAICAPSKRITPALAQNYPPAQQSCCGKKPPKFPDLPANATAPAQTYSTFSGQIAVVTGQLLSNSSVVVVDLKGENAGLPLDSNWAAPLYRHPNWATTKIGDVFGVTLDDQGDVYVTATTSYFLKSAVTTSNPGNVYRIDGTTGAVNVFAALPNKKPALGNIDFSCRHRSFYVTNFADGRIYQMVTDNSTSPPTGRVVSTFAHATGTIATGFSSKNGDPETGRDYSRFIPKNASDKNWGRPWGVKVRSDRLYYGLWRQDSGQNVAPDAHANEVWSVQLAPTGGFVAGSQKLEFSLPTLQSTDPAPAGGAKAFSNPVSSISFNTAGNMLVAERSMNGDENNKNGGFAAHASRVLEYALVGTTWTPHNPPNFGPGVLYFSGSPSSAGGADYDSFGSRVWATVDAMHFPNTIHPGPPHTDRLYGIQGLPLTGGTIQNSLLVDLTDNPVSGDKNQMGDVAIPCGEEAAPRECAVKSEEISCKADGTGGYVYTFTVANNTGKPVTKVLVTPPPNSNLTITPQNVPLPNGVLPNGQSTTLTVTIKGGMSGQKACFTVTLMTEDGPCCTVEVCPVLPECCAVATNVGVRCNPNGSYSYVLSIVNTSPNAIQHIYLYPPAGVTMTPSYFAVSLAPGATFQTPPIIITGARPGSFCFSLSLHSEGMKECCSGDQCIMLPECHVNPER